MASWTTYLWCGTHDQLLTILSVTYEAPPVSLLAFYEWGAALADLEATKKRGRGERSSACL